MQADVIFRNANIIDGTGSPAFTGDVAILDDRITAIGDLGTEHGGREIDCHDLTLAPGFIDPHVHHDEALLTDPGMDCMLSQGVTTIIAGNCGFSIAPLTATMKDLPQPLGMILTSSRPRFARFADYRNQLRQTPAAVNSACLIGHGTLRINEVADLGRPADAGELKAMQTSLDQALDEGGIGVSTGLFYPPARAATTEEAIAMARIAKSHGKLYVTHMRDEGDHGIDALKETFEIGQESCCGVHVSHHKCAGLANHGQSEITLSMFRDAMRQQDVSLDTTPWTASSTMLNSGRHRQATRVIVADSIPYPQMAGRDLADIAREWNTDLDTAMERLLPATGIFFIMDESDVRRILSFEHTIICSDGIARGDHSHPRVWGTFPRVLGHYVRDVGLFSLEEAIKRMTSMPAQRFGLKDRGHICKGAFADLVLFDPATIQSGATYEKPKTPAYGIKSVWVNGRESWADGKNVGNRAGMLLDRDVS